MRARFASNGIARPLEEFTTLHAMLDVVEAAVLESFSSGKDAKENERDRTNFLDKMYAPERGTKLDGDGYKPAPAGFDEANMESAFDAFLASAR